MTKKQQEFYRLIVNQMVDFNEDFHKEFTIKRIQSINDEQLKYLLEDINIDKDKIGSKKGYLTYSKFIYYADKFQNKALLLDTKKQTKPHELYKKRDWLLKSIESQSNTLEEKNKLIEGLQNRTLMFSQDGKNILDSIDYFIIEKFGFFNFFDENKNYHILEEIEKYYKDYLTQPSLTHKQNLISN
jgi:hypothetical protein